VELPDGQRLEHHVLRMPRRSVTVVVLDEEGDRVLLLWRHRFITDTWGWEVPAGWTEGDEAQEETATRLCLLLATTGLPARACASAAGLPGTSYRPGQYVLTARLAAPREKLTQLAESQRKDPCVVLISRPVVEPGVAARRSRHDPPDGR
jgi:hypothetical protein